jgi:LAO/AO transport system kinase
MAVWQAIEDRYAQRKARGELDQRRRRQRLRWLWSMVEDRLREAVRTHPAVEAIRAQLEHDVTAGTLPPEAAARQILNAFGL